MLNVSQKKSSFQTISHPLTPQLTQSIFISLFPHPNPFSRHIDKAAVIFGIKFPRDLCKDSKHRRQSGDLNFQARKTACFSCLSRRRFQLRRRPVPWQFFIIDLQFSSGGNFDPRKNKSINFNWWRKRKWQGLDPRELETQRKCYCRT